MARSKIEYDYEPLDENGVNITHFRVIQAERRKGMGTAVMRALLDRFATEGYRYVVVNMGGGEVARRFLTDTFSMRAVEGPNHDGFVTAELDLDERESAEN
jgi:GNAT superfamily N-acetyltransferase